MDTRLVLITAAVCLSAVYAPPPPQQNFMPGIDLVIPPQQNSIPTSQIPNQPQQSFFQPEQNYIVNPQASIPPQPSFIQPEQNVNLPQQKSSLQRQSYNLPWQYHFRPHRDYINYRRYPAIEQSIFTYPNGSYSFHYLGYESARSEKGEFRAIGKKDPALAVQGYYGFVSPEGHIYEVYYKADENGFHPHTHLFDPRYDAHQEAKTKQVEARPTEAPTFPFK